MVHSATLLAALTTWITTISAAPSGEGGVLSKRAANNPIIGAGFSAQETTQLLDAFSNALELASYVVTTPDSVVDPIFQHYFNEGDKDLVLNVFKSILGGDPNNPPGNEFLTRVTIRQDYPNEAGNTVCDGQNMAATRGGNTDTPAIIVCPDAGFGHGALAKGYPGAPAVTCDFLDPRVSWKMETLGSILLHEYTHVKGLVVPPLQQATDDVSEDTYGPFGSRNIDKSQATNNADNYVWFANELFFSVVCEKSYDAPTEEDGDDPNCDDQVCTDEDEEMDDPQ